VFLGVALTAAQFPNIVSRSTTRLLALLLAVGAITDFVFGLALHFAATALQLNRAPGQDILSYVGTLNRAAGYNLWQKLRLGQDWVADLFPVPWWHALALFGALALLLGLRARRLTVRDDPAAADERPSHLSGANTTGA
jgi:hypothetical protein